MDFVLCIVIKSGERRQRKWVERGEYVILSRQVVSFVSNYTSLRQFLQEWDERARIGIMWLWVGPAARTCEKGNETSGSTKCGEFLEWLRTCELIREDSAPVKQLISQSISLDKLWKARVEERRRK
jgi:hypothetical protein